MAQQFLVFAPLSLVRPGNAAEIPNEVHRADQRHYQTENQAEDRRAAAQWRQHRHASQHGKQAADLAQSIEEPEVQSAKTKLVFDVHLYLVDRARCTSDFHDNLNSMVTVPASAMVPAAGPMASALADFL
jgi:hypothetical protein